MLLLSEIAIPQIQSSNIEAVIQQATLAQDADSIAAAAGAIALGRVYTATSLPSHIWSLNGKSLQLHTLLAASIFNVYSAGCWLVGQSAI